MDAEPDDKDWTWVLERACPDCGLNACEVEVRELPERFAANGEAWQAVLRRPDVRERPRPRVWSPLEYACHVRDVHRVFDARLQLLLGQSDPLFANWDQDVAAADGRYGSEDPQRVAAELVDATAAVVQLWQQVRPDQHQRPGRRSNGSVFTVTTLGRYHLHDVEHHLWDVRG